MGEGMSKTFSFLYCSGKKYCLPTFERRETDFKSYRRSNFPACNTYPSSNGWMVGHPDDFAASASVVHGSNC